ncbi:tetratricopeptide repeat protein [Pusillimonas sp.]|uniref:tetratricopeptide repeat protein n=1 Tax=Pusillimonas sp. TaxID=3040095 RepID=UPI0037C77CB3
MVTDLQGNTVAGATPRAVEYFNEAIAAFNVYQGDPISALDNALGESPDFAMAHIAKAHLFAAATEPALSAAASEIVQKLKTMHLNNRESSHVQALELQLSSRWSDAAVHLDMHNMRYPHDILALQCGHLMDFYRGCSRNLRDRIARVLPQWPAEMPGYSILLGMYAFGLEEMGEYAKAEEHGRLAVELQPLDTWAHHAVAHVFEMQDRPQEGVDWMMTRKQYWAGDQSFFKVHNWWHHALYLMELGTLDEALGIYDAHIRKEQSTIALELVDASAMLWRLHLAGVDLKGRWNEVAQCWDEHADGRSYTFNDWHAVMAYLGAGREDDATRLIDEFQRDRARMTEVDEWTHDIARPLAQGFVAFWHEDYPTAIQKLHPVRYIANRFGGSHAQRDIIDLTLIEAALRSEQPRFIAAFANERLALKPGDLMNHRLLQFSSGQNFH